MKKLRKNFVFLLFLFPILLVWDQLSKYYFYNLAVGQELSFLEIVFNTGISRWVAVPSWIVLWLSFVSLVFFVFLYLRKHLTWFMLAFMLAGTIGNLIDRIWLGWVRDFISLWSFPVFNLADVWLNIGVILFLLAEIRLTLKHRSSKN